MDKDAPTFAVWSHSSKSIDLPYANGGQKDILLRSANIKKRLCHYLAVCHAWLLQNESSLVIHILRKCKQHISSWKSKYQYKFTGALKQDNYVSWSLLTFTLFISVTEVRDLNNLEWDSDLHWTFQELKNPFCSIFDGHQLSPECNAHLNYEERGFGSWALWSIPWISTSVYSTMFNCIFIRKHQ